MVALPVRGLSHFGGAQAKGEKNPRAFNLLLSSDHHNHSIQLYTRIVANLSIRHDYFCHPLQRLSVSDQLLKFKNTPARRILERFGVGDPSQVDDFLGSGMSIWI
jgi:hypothetical protein